MNKSLRKVLDLAHLYGQEWFDSHVDQFTSGFAVAAMCREDCGTISSLDVNGPTDTKACDTLVSKGDNHEET